MQTENKLSRICWNKNNWKFPSGSEGKSPSTKSYESDKQFGHEEWLLDSSRIIDGFHYGFLQPLMTKTDKHAGKIYNITLFTIRNSTKYFVGTINNAVCISREESKGIYELYKKKGWIKEMELELEKACVNPYPFKETSPEICFNVKFCFKDFTPTQSGYLEEISSIKNHRYKLLSKKGDLHFTTEVFENEGNLKNTEIVIRNLTGDTIFDPIHNKIQNALYMLLRDKCAKYKNVYIEKNNIDVQALTHDNKWHFYEIKTDNPKYSIRKGLGQLLEYAFYPKNERAQKLIIISDSLPDQSIKEYMVHIRSKFSIPIFYQTFDLDKNELSQEY